MYSRQKQTLDSFVRVRSFLDAHPVSGPLTYDGPRATLDAVVPKLREHAGAQITGRELSRGETRRQEQLVQRIVDRHMRPIVSTARAQIEPESDVRMPAALRMPRGRVRGTLFVQACDGMIAAARPFEAAFIAKGLPADFLARFTAARNELEGVLGGRSAFIGTHVGARAGLAVQVRRGRRAVEQLDAVVRASFEGDEVTLAQWRAAKRVQKVSGGSSARTEPEAPEVTQAQPAQQLPHAA